MLSKEEIMDLGYDMIHEITEANSPRYKEEIFHQLEIIAYILGDDIPKPMDIFIMNFRDLL